MVTRVQTASKSSRYNVRTTARRPSFRPLLELLEARLVFASDFGDAPLPYPTLLSEGGAEHVAIGPTLGSQRDTEADGVHSPGADADDNAGSRDDEDGVTFGTIRAGALGASATVNVQGGPGKLDAWIDFNGDGAWGGPGEQIADSVPMGAGNNTVSFDVPSWAADGTRFARFRLSTTGNLGVGGIASDGEVEDHSVTIQSPEAACGCFAGPENVNFYELGPKDVHAADMDGDGDTDILSASSYKGRLAWYENDGSRVFEQHIIISNAAEHFLDVFAADVDADGDIDVLSAFANTIAWYENDGSQNFTFHYIGLALGARSVHAADIDVDGDTDVFATSSHFESGLDYDDRITWYENDGSQTFTPRTISTNIHQGTSVLTADVDSDGDIDVLSASYRDDKIAWYENDGTQNFIDRTISTSADSARSVYAADVDSDGDIDVLSASFRDDKIAWYQNDGNQNFTARIISTSADGALRVYAADLDGDGDIDVLSASNLDDKIAWYENDGNENFATHIITNVADGAYSVFATDVDGDNDVDVLSASYKDHEIAWYENDGNRNFSTQIVATSGAFSASVYPADLDSDGDTDILSASNHDNITWYENNGSELYIRHEITTAVDAAASVVAADVDGDGDTDVLSASFKDDKIAWYENDGNENFTTHIITNAADGAYSVFTADVDGDGDTDVLSASIYDNTIAWYENDGYQNFTAHTITTTVFEAISVYAADVDRDGDIDVLAASGAQANYTWYENDGNQNFAAHTIGFVDDVGGQLFTADMDGDGDIDIVVVGRWYENDGSQNFIPHVINPFAWRVYPADMDGDGDLDVLTAVVGSGGTYTIAWYENDGSQNFTSHPISTPGQWRALLPADVDGDGDLDIVAGSFLSRDVIWYENLDFVVDNTNDSGPGSLRQAIELANANPGVDTITFAIGGGYQTIAPTSALPTITDSVIIDGTTQPGYTGAPLIEVWGFAAGPNVHGLVIAADDSIVKGIVVNLFSGNGILITGSGNRIENSYIGTDFSGTIAVPNALNGVEIISGSNNTIGGSDPGTANIIAFNDGHGVLIDAGTSNAIRQNSIQSNDGLGIDLINGGNNNQAAPIVTRWTSAGGTTKAWLTLTSTPSTMFSIDVFRNAVCDPSGFGEGEVFLGTAMLTTGAGGTGSIIAVFGVGVPLNQYITATATSPANDTSEFSNCRPFRLKAPPSADFVTPLPLPLPPAPPSGDGEVQEFIFTPLPLAPVTVANQRPLARFAYEWEFQPSLALPIMPSVRIAIDCVSKPVSTRLLARSKGISPQTELAVDLEPKASSEL